MEDLAKLLRQLDAVKQRRDYELRINGKTQKYKNLLSEYYTLLSKVGRATE